MGGYVKNAGNQDEFWTRERCFIREIANIPEINDFSLAQTRVEPGVITELHRLSVKEWYLVSSGTGLVDIAGEGIPVSAGDIVEIPAGTPQRITNCGTDDLVFMCVCMPRFTTKACEALEDD